MSASPSPSGVAWSRFNHVCKDIKASTQDGHRPKQCDKPERQLNVIGTQQETLSQSDSAPSGRTRLIIKGKMLGANKAAQQSLDLAYKEQMMPRWKASYIRLREKRGRVQRTDHSNWFRTGKTHRAAPPSTTPGPHDRPESTPE